MKVLKGMMKERMADAGRQPEDFLDVMIVELRKENPVLTETVALDLMFVLLFASFETTALALTLGIKLLTDNPRVLEALTVSCVNCLQLLDRRCVPRQGVQLGELLAPKNHRPRYVVKWMHF